MASNLSKSIDFTKKAVLLFVAFTILSFLMQWIGVVLTTEDVPIPIDTYDASAYLPIDNKLGVIPAPKLISLTLTPNTTASFAIASNKKLPEFPNTVNVYEIKDFRDKLGNSDNARKVAQILDFAPQEDQIVNNTLYWFNTSNTRTFSYNKITQNWSLEVNLDTDPVIKQAQPLDKTLDYDQLTRAIQTEILLAPEHYADSNSTIHFININSDSTYTDSKNPDFAQYVRIAQYRNIEASTLKEQFNVESVVGPTVTYFANIRKSLHSDASTEIIVQNTNAEDTLSNLIKFKFRDFEYGEVGVYPLIDVELAWENVQRNQGVLYDLRPEGDNPFSSYTQLNIREFRIDVDKTSIIYIEPEDKSLSDKWTHYLQPFYMFSGTAIIDDGRKAEFSFLVEALTPESYQD